MKKKWLVIGGFTLLHLFATAIAIASSFSMGMSRFDTGVPMTLREHAWSTLADLLLCPLGPLSKALHLGRLGDLVLLANSFLWGAALYWVTNRLFRAKAAKGIATTN
jgi:hypothetical protein